MNEAALKKEKKGLIYEVMNATNMTFADGSFDFVIDKGTLDALACGNET
jgi:ubiquinone/menaquinone biosynthesis C-methylase UbiE